MRHHAGMDDEVGQDAAAAAQRAAAVRALAVAGLGRGEHAGEHCEQQRRHDVGQQRGGQAQAAQPQAAGDQHRQQCDPQRPQRPLPGDADQVDEQRLAQRRGAVVQQQRQQVQALQLHPALGPALLLQAVGGQRLRQLGRHRELAHEARAPAAQQHADAELAVLDQAGRTPAADRFDRAGAPDAGGAGEVDEVDAGRAECHLQRVMVVDPQRLRRGQRRLVVVEVTPLGLDQCAVGHRAAGGVVEVRDRALEGVGRWNEVGVEDGDELGVGLLPAVFERAGLVAGAPRPVDPGAAHAARAAHAVADGLDHRAGRGVGRVVEHLDAQPIARPAQRGGGFDDAAGHGVLVEHRQLHADRGQLRRQPARCVRPAAAPEPADALDHAEAQHQQDEQVGQVQQRHQGPGRRGFEAAARQRIDRVQPEQRGVGQREQPQSQPPGQAPPGGQAAGRGRCGGCWRRTGLRGCIGSRRPGHARHGGFEVHGGTLGGGHVATEPPAPRAIPAPGVQQALGGRRHNC